jgi:hypothetical protein
MEGYDDGMINVTLHFERQQTQVNNNVQHFKINRVPRSLLSSSYSNSIGFPISIGSQSSVTSLDSLGFLGFCELLGILAFNAVWFQDSPRIQNSQNSDRSLKLERRRLCCSFLSSRHFFSHACSSLIINKYHLKGGIWSCCATGTTEHDEKLSTWLRSKWDVRCPWCFWLLMRCVLVLQLQFFTVTELGKKDFDNEGKHTNLMIERL